MLARRTRFLRTPGGRKKRVPPAKFLAPLCGGFRALIERPYSSNPVTSATARHFAVRGFPYLALF
jgi:hypothetical protein